MNSPKRRGTPVDETRIEAWATRFSGYRQEVTVDRIQSWLGQFDANSQDVAARLLDAVQFITHEDIEAKFKHLLAGLPGWHRSSRRRKGKWRFVPFSRGEGESGNLVLARLRTAAGLEADDHSELFINKRDLPLEELEADDTVVFVDDFAGTGKQVCDCWHDFMAELLPGEPSAFLVLIAVGASAIERIQDETELQIASSISLDDSDGLFSTKCRHFNTSEKATLQSFCEKADRRYPLGFGNCGFVIVLAHKTPNNSLPVLHVRNSRWKGLFPRK